MKTDIVTCISYFKGLPHKVTYPLGYWKAGMHRSVSDQKYIAIKRFAWLYERHNYEAFESNVAIKRWVVLRIDQTLLLCISYRHLLLGFDGSEM